ncbi:MAG: glycoside hydrolase family 95 protein, partial [Segetibacter sp.]
DNPDALTSLPEIRKLVFERKQKEAEKLAAQTIQTKKSNGQMFQPVGSLHLRFNGHDKYSNYYRELNIERAITKTSYTVGKVNFTREVFASIPDRVIVIRLKASKPGSISFSASLTTPQPIASVKATTAKELIVAGTTPGHEGVPGMVKFKGIAKIKTEGGIVSSTDSTLVIDGANAATVFISIATNFNSYKDISGDENRRAITYLNKAFAKPYSSILNAHLASYQKYFNRVKFDLGSTDTVNQTTNVRLK